MKKIFNIAWKDLIITINDPPALIMTILTPFALTLVMIFAFGGVSDGGISDIPILIVNLDQSEMGARLVDVFASQELSDLISPEFMDDPTAARTAVDKDEYAAAVIIPINIGDGYYLEETSQVSPQKQPNNGSKNSDLIPSIEPAIIEVYGNPTRPTSVSIVLSIVDEFIHRAISVSAGIQVSIRQMVKFGILEPSALKTTFPDDGSFINPEYLNQRMIGLKSSFVDDSKSTEFDWFGYIAPSMALLFLMFTVSNGGRSILAEIEDGTISRMLTSPTYSSQILGGKVLGIYFNGVLQLTVLFLSSFLLLQINWGPAPVVIPTILFVVAAATGWGMLIAAFSRTSAQASILGTAITLIFAIGSGSFFPRQFLPEWLQYISFLSPNAWGIEAFNHIRLGATPIEMLPFWGGMIMMFVILFISSVLIFRNQFR